MIMDLCADTNILIYITNDRSPFHSTTLDAVSKILSRGDELVVFPQNLIEFWAVATRPVEINGLGMTVEQVEYQLKQIQSNFTVMSETPAIYPEWEKLVVSYGVRGKSVHDARIAAQMNVHGFGSLLTFNTQDFERFPTIDAVDPVSI